MQEVDNTFERSFSSNSKTRHKSARQALLTVPALLACAGLALTGCVQSADASQEQTLVYATGDAEPTCLDPHVGGNYPQALISSQYLEPLFARDEKGEIRPWLAKSWKVSDDGLTVDITLRGGIKFTDGTKLDAAAVKANIEHLQDPDTQSSTGYLAVAKVASVEVVSASLARLHMKEPDAAILESLSQHWTAIESPAGIARGMEENCKAPIGTGPFKVEKWEPQQQVTLTRNSAYKTTDPLAEHEGPAYLHKIVWRFVPDAATRFAQLRTGEVNVVDNPLPADILQAEQNGGLSIGHLDAPRTGSSARLELNSSITPFDDVRVREAFILTANPNPGIEKLFYGSAKRSYSLLSSREPWAVSEPALFKTDMTRAKQLLDEAGWVMGADGVRQKDGKQLTVRIPVSTNQSTPAEQALFEQIQANTAKVGFAVQLQPLDLGTWYEKLGDNEYEAVSAPYTKVGSDVLRILYHSSGTVPAPSGYFANHAWLRDSKVDDLLTAAASSMDASEREELVREAQDQILRQYVVLPLYDQQNHFLTHGVSGVRTLHTISTPTFLDARVGG